MATAKTKFARMKQTAERLDWLMANARILRSPALRLSGSCGGR